MVERECNGDNIQMRAITLSARGARSRKINVSRERNTGKRVNGYRAQFALLCNWVDDVVARASSLSLPHC